MDFEDVEDAIIAKIKTDMTYVKTVETYAGQLETEVEKLTIIFPATYVIYGPSKFEWVDGLNFNETPRFTVLIASKNLRGGDAARKDTSIGCYKMIKDVLIHLTNQKLGLDIERLKPTGVNLIYVSKLMTVYGIDFETNFDTAYA